MSRLSITWLCHRFSKVSMAKHEETTHHCISKKFLVCKNQGVRNFKKSCTRFHFFQDFKGFGWDFRFQNHRIRSVFDHVTFDIRIYTKIYSTEFAIRSHTKLCNTAPVILRFAAILRWINGQYTEFTANFQDFKISWDLRFQQRFQRGCTRFQGVVDPLAKTCKNRLSVTVSLHATTRVTEEHAWGTTV